MNELLDRVARNIRERKLFVPGEGILVAVSGGVDSMVLLHVLVRLAVGERWKMAVVHVDHQLRGRQSLADARFVARAAKRFGLRVSTGKVAVRDFMRQERSSLEMAARTLRHEFLAATARRSRIRKIALAHHADDQAELFLMRLLRGSGASGLGGMKWRGRSPADPRIELVRPLLNISKRELERFADEQKISYRMDQSNSNQQILRNRIRNELLPLIEKKYSPAFAQTVSRSAELLRDESEALDDLARNWLKQRQPCFAELPIALQRRVLQLQLLARGDDCDFETVEKLRLLPGRGISLKPGRIVQRDESGVVRESGARERDEFLSAEMNLTIRPSGVAEFDGLRVEWRRRAVRQSVVRFGRKQGGHESFDADKVGDTITLRHWRAGDRFQPIGMRHAIKLQDWFVNQKVPRVRRRELVLACTSAGVVFWVEGMRIGEGCKITAHTRRSLAWKWQR